MKVKVCVIQDSPVFFDKKRSIDKLETLVKKNSAKGVQLILFPESFIPGYPRGFSFGAVVGKRSDAGKKLYAEYHKNSIDLESNDLKRLTSIAKKSKVYLVVGVTERQSKNGSLYCSMLYISPKKGLLGVHRKIKPTGTERLIWAESDGKDLVSFDTKVGKLGGLICWENYMPLARMSMYQKGVQIYLAPTADGRESWISTMQHIAMEGRCYVLGSNQYFSKSMYPKKYKSLIDTAEDNICRGGSVIVGPNGQIIKGPIWDKAGALTATLDLDTLINHKMDFDAAGHYNRPDVFDFKVNGQPAMQKES